MSAVGISSEARFRAPSLDALRLVASLAITIGHIVPADLIPDALHDLLLSGVSTTLFFAMSGFVLSTSNRFWEQSWRETGVKRFSRLYSIHLLCFSLLLPFAFLGSDTASSSELLRVLGWWGTGMQGLLPYGSFQELWNFPAWAVTALLIGGLTLPWLKLAKLRNWPLSSSCGLLFVFIGIRLAIDLLQDSPASEFQTIQRHMAFLPRLLEVNAGAMSGVVFNQLGTRFNLRWLGSDQALALLILFVASAIIFIHYFHGMPGLFTFTHGPVLPIVLLLVASAYLNQGSIANFCRYKWIVKGAQISILVWLLHIPVLRYWQYAAPRIGMGVDWTSGIVGFCLNFSLVLLAARILELPVRKLEQSLTRTLLRWTSVKRPQIPSVS